MALPVIADDGSWVNGEYERLGRIVKEYDDRLALAWIPPDDRALNEKFPYAIIDTRNDQVVFYITADETPEEILGRLFTSDGKQGNVLDRLNAKHAALEAWRLKTQHDEMLEAQELATFMIKSPKNFMHLTNTAGEKVKLDDQRRRIG